MNVLSARGRSRAGPRSQDLRTRARREKESMRVISDDEQQSYRRKRWLSFGFGRRSERGARDFCHGLLGIGLLIFAAGTTTAQITETQRKLLKDWGGLIRYGSENAELRAPKANEDRVVFLGDQVTELWGQGGAKFFPGKPFLNRGIAGQTSAQMLVRFHQDVVALKPKVVVIQAGINDLLVSTEGVMADNYMSMMDIAKATGIRVVLASVTPVCDCYTNQTALRPQGKIIGLNGWIRDFAASSGAVFLNYYAALADGRNFKKELTGDGLLPNEAGYGVMAPLAEKAIAEALDKK